ncbi:MAG: hypothetical protein WBG90_11110 [Saonia sp.]
MAVISRFLPLDTYKLNCKLKTISPKTEDKGRKTEIGNEKLEVRNEIPDAGI